MPKKKYARHAVHAVIHGGVTLHVVRNPDIEEKKTKVLVSLPTGRILVVINSGLLYRV